MRNDPMKARTCAALLLGALLTLGACASRPPQKSFASPEEAVTQLIAALRADDISQLEQILGPDSQDLLHSGDDVADRNGRKRFVELYDEKHSIDKSKPDVATLCIGKLEWPVPIPIVRGSETWTFDTEAGREEMLNRRIGRNELSAVQVCLACIDAQNEYVEKDRDGDGVLEYAPKFRSTPGAHDGLYWEVKEGEPPSPLGDLAAKAESQGYTPRKSEEERRPYWGYYYRILTAQGANAPGGAYDYMARDDMIGGCAIVAWPAEYGVSGVMTFIVSHDGIVYEKDLGEVTDEVASSMTLFDPDPSWKKEAK